ncbi:hypothetical protein E8E14_007672 [Neopestalotiopsis sp. 37M]|nr:hypothetical protein E8E14_007672 [Neopestalotiopsis sp. 37M]
MDPTTNGLSLVDFDKFDFYDAVFTVRQEVYLLIDEEEWVMALFRVAHGLSKKLQAEVGFCSTLYFQLTYADALWEHLLGTQASLSPWKASLRHLRQNGQQYDALEKCVNPGDLIWINPELSVEGLAGEEDFFTLLEQKVLSPKPGSLDSICDLMESLKIGPYTDSSARPVHTTEKALEQQSAEVSLKRARDDIHEDRPESNTKRQNTRAEQGQ